MFVTLLLILLLMKCTLFKIFKKNLGLVSRPHRTIFTVSSIPHDISEITCFKQRQIYLRQHRIEVNKIRSIICITNSSLTHCGIDSYCGISHCLEYYNFYRIKRGSQSPSISIFRGFNLVFTIMFPVPKSSINLLISRSLTSIFKY